MKLELGENRAPAARPSWGIEFLAGLSTYLTLSYIFLLNPVLLAKTGMDINAAFFGTVVSACLSTLLMARMGLPFAVASAPSITAFFVGYVFETLGLSWQQALTAVFVSGFLSVAMALFGIRKKLIDSVPEELSIGVIFAISGFLIANGLTQAKLISYSDGFIDISKVLPGFDWQNAVVFCTGLIVTVFFRLSWLKFSGAPLLGIIAAAIVAAFFKIEAKTPASLSTKMFSAIGKLDFSPFLNPGFVLSILVFFIIDFFGGVGKYIGLFAVMGNRASNISKEKLKPALVVDGVGTIIGSLTGAASLAVFISSVVGIVTGGRTGRTAFFCALFMGASFAVLPLVGTIPVQATSGILFFIAFLLIPWKKVFGGALRQSDILVSLAAALVSFLTYGIDKAMLLIFVVYSAEIVWKGEAKSHKLLLLVTLLLLAAVVFQELS